MKPNSDSRMPFTSTNSATASRLPTPALGMAGQTAPASRRASAKRFGAPEDLANAEEGDAGHALIEIVPHNADQSGKQTQPQLGVVLRQRIEHTHGLALAMQSGKQRIQTRRTEAEKHHFVQAEGGTEPPEVALPAILQRLARSGEDALGQCGGNILIAAEPRDLLDQIDLPD